MNTDTPTSVNQFDPTPDEMARQLREMRYFLGSLVAALAYRQLRDGPVTEEETSISDRSTMRGMWEYNCFSVSSDGSIRWREGDRELLTRENWQPNSVVDWKNKP